MTSDLCWLKSSFHSAYHHLNLSFFFFHNSSCAKGRFHTWPMFSKKHKDLKLGKVKAFQCWVLQGRAWCERCVSNSMKYSASFLPRSSSNPMFAVEILSLPFLQTFEHHGLHMIRMYSQSNNPSSLDLLPNVATTKSHSFFKLTSPPRGELSQGAWAGWVCWSSDFSTSLLARLGNN